MKTKITFAVSAILFIIFCSMAGIRPSDKKNMIIEINKASTQFYLDSLVGALDKQKIILKLVVTQFNNAGQLQKVAGEIHFPKVGNGTFSTDSLDKIIIRKSPHAFSIAVNPKDK